MDKRNNTWRKNYDGNASSFSGSYSTSGTKPKQNLYTKKSANRNKNLKEAIYSSVSAFNESKTNFSDVYAKWLSIRRLTLEKLETLVKELHKKQREFNETQIVLREVGSFSRQAKTTPSTTINTFGGIFSLLTDVASGFASIAQAVNVNEYSEKFKEIMDPDAEAIKRLYEARSQCEVDYQGIEEITRQYLPPTFNSTASRISKDLDVKNLLMAVNLAYCSNDVSRMLSIIGNFVESGCQMEVLRNIGDSIVTCIDENPAVLDVCDSAFRAARGAFDLVYMDGKKSETLSVVARASNELMIREDRRQIQRLNSMVEDDSSQSKLEDKIRNTIYTLQTEMDEIVNAYNQY